MNHIYQRWLKLSSGLVAEARESWQQHPNPECRELLFQRYMDLSNEMETLEVYLSKKHHSRGVKSDFECQTHFIYSKPRDKIYHVDLRKLLRHSTDGIWFE